MSAGVSRFLPFVLAFLVAPASGGARAADAAPLIRSARSGPWSAPATWEGGKVPAAGTKVQIRQGHTIVYDTSSSEAIRSLHIAGTLTFATNRDTLLEVGL